MKISRSMIAPAYTFPFKRNIIDSMNETNGAI